MDIKEIALRISEKADEYADAKLQSKGEFHPDWHTVRDEYFAESLIAEITKQNKPVAWWNGKETAFFEHETDGPVGEVKIPLYTFPPTAEQIANETAEAIASFVDTTATYDTSKEIAEAIRSGAWKEFK